MSPTFGGDGEAGFDFRAHLRIILKRKKLIAACAISALTLGYLWFLLITPVYTATVRIQVDPETKIVERGDITAGETRNTEYMKTQLELLQSANLAERVASIANLSAAPEPEKSSRLSLSMLFGGKSKTPGPTAAPLRNDVGAGAVLGGRAVKAIPGSRLIDISFTDPSPQRAQTRRKRLRRRLYQFQPR